MRMTATAFVTAGLVTILSFQTAGMDVAVRGKPTEYKIVLPVCSEESRVYAADELRKYVKLLTGVTLKIETGSHPAKGIYLDRTADATLGGDGFRLRSDGFSFRIEGRARGVLYGVYELLERFGGVGWYASWYTDVPEIKRLVLPDDFDERQTPSFPFRLRAWADVKEHPEFAAHLRYNDYVPKIEHSRKFGPPAFRFLRGLSRCHTFHELLRGDRTTGEYEEWARKNPACFSEIDGLRITKGAQPCLSNPETRRIMISNILLRVRREMPDPSVDTLLIAGVSQDDFVRHCKCAACRETDAQEGSSAGTLVAFINEAYDAVYRERPDVQMQTLIYQYTRKFPRRARFRKGVIPCVCSVECDFSRPMAQRQSRVNSEFMDDLLAWSGVSDQIMMWDYTTDYSHYLYPMPNIRVMQPNLKTFRNCGVKFIYEEGGPYHADFAELKAWLIAKLEWNVDQSVDDLVERFMKGFYGAAAPYVRQYFNRVETLLDGHPRALLTCWEHDRPNIFTDEFVEWSQNVLSKAELAVRADAARRDHVRYVRASTRVLRLDRQGRFVKHINLTQKRETAATSSAVLKEDAAEMLNLYALSGKSGQRMRVQEAEERMWKWIVSTQMVHSVGGVTTVPVDHLSPHRYLGKSIAEKTALGGKAIRINLNEDHEPAAKLDFAGVAYDPNVRYQVRVHVCADVVPGQAGEAFLAKFAGQKIAPNARDLKAGWQWYAFDPVNLHGNEVLSLYCGRLSHGGGAHVLKKLLLDAVEILELPSSIEGEAAK